MGPHASSATRGGPAPVPVDDLEAGMILAEDVHDAQGRLLMPRGTALTERHLRAFQLWGIVAVRVRGEGDEGDGAPPPISPEVLAEADAYVRARFRRHDPNHPLLAALITAAVQRIARRLMAGSTSHG